VTTTRATLTKTTTRKDEYDNVDENDPNHMNFPHRHGGIRMHPDSISRKVLPPGNMVWQRSKPRKGRVRKQKYLELEYGYFWNIRDLKNTNEKPILSNETLIPEKDSKVFPKLEGLKSLASPSQQINLPDFFMQPPTPNSSSSSLSSAASATSFSSTTFPPNKAWCTIVSVSFRDYGFRLLPSWLEPLQQVCDGNHNKEHVQILRINITEGWFNSWFLRPVLRVIMKLNTVVALRPWTFLYFGSTKVLEECRDALRMHNSMTCFVFLVDANGRVRFAGSGSASNEEVERLILMTRLLTSPLSSSPSSSLLSGGKRKK
jgi:mitochondrial ATPase complex subunit ATP10